MDLDNAIGKHTDWKTKLRLAISKKETLDVATISKDNCCELGKWLHGEAKTRLRQLTSYSECVTKHAAFHVEAGKIATAINSQKYTEAEAMFNAGTPYTAASSAVGVAIMRLKKEAAL
ncbi:MAG: CZB domain-containing protein [Planctomycetes bacterium]|nr:CZB domain-containing protein [Planctomycetota bacterium]